jgi:hypothetical protein
MVIGYGAWLLQQFLYEVFRDWPPQNSHAGSQGAIFDIFKEKILL